VLVLHGIINAMFMSSVSLMAYKLTRHAICHVSGDGGLVTSEGTS